MRIAMIGQGTFEEMPGGASRHLSGLVAELRRGGHDVRVLTSASILPTSGPLGGGGLGRAVRAALRIIGLIPAGCWFVARHRPDVVNVHFALDGLGAVVGAALTRSPLVATFHGPWALEAGSGRATGLRRAIEEFVYRRATACIAMSRPFAELLGSEYRIDPRRIHVVPLGIDVGRFVPRDRGAARARLGLPDRPTLVTVRRLVPRVGLDLAIRALACMPPGARPGLVVAGTGPEQGRLEELARSEGVAEEVTFLGFVPDDDLPYLYSAGDVCVVPSRELEGFGYGALEALACGTPVVAVRTGGLVDLLTGLEPRWLVAWNPAELARVVASVLAAPHLYPSREACRAHAERFSWPHIAARTVDVYRRIESPQVMMNP